MDEWMNGSMVGLVRIYGGMERWNNGTMDGSMGWLVGTMEY